MTAPTKHPRPWYCSDDWVDEYVTILGRDSDFTMIRSAKIIRAIVVNLGVIAITLYSLSLGADPTIVGTFGVITLGLYNGVELADYAALVQALAEVSAQTSSDDPPDDDE
mgnify:CR=1 FL=1